MNIAIVDDMLMEIELLKEILADYNASHTVELTVDSFQSVNSFLEAFRPYSYSLIFMDIYMDEMSGVDATREIRKVDRDVPLVFLTTSSNHMPEAFSFHAYDYITKPATPARIYQLMDDITKLNGDSEDMYFDFVIDHINHHLAYSDIMAIRTTVANYLEIIDKDGNAYKIRQTFSAVSEMFEYDSRFLLLLRGILVNMDYIVNLYDNSCELQHDIMLPVNVRYFRKICQTYNNYCFIKNKSGDKKN